MLLLYCKSENGLATRIVILLGRIAVLGLHVYIDAAYCYRPTSVVCRSACLPQQSALQKTAEPIEMPFGI